MSRGTEWKLDEATHHGYMPKQCSQEAVFTRPPLKNILAPSFWRVTGSGKRGLAEAAKSEFAGNVGVIDLDEQREVHKNDRHLRQTHPYT